jgi:antitoxin component YwqK of YwqJK toxin-antitoxin module
MHFRLLITAYLIFIPATLLCQPESGINKSDPSGRKQGHWIRKYPNNSVMYEGFFTDNNPEGIFKRYYADGNIRSVLNYSNNGSEAEAEIYHTNGYLAARGKYIRQKKEGLWQFYSEYESGYLVSEDIYSGNLRNGSSVKFYPDGTTAEKMNFFNDTAQGEWIKYYSNGNICLKSSYLDGRINGRFEAWFENGTLHFSGEYRSDKREGTWFIYEKDGSIRYKLEYKGGVTENREMDIDLEDYLDSLEENKDKIPDPEKTGSPW